MGFVKYTYSQLISKFKSDLLWRPREKERERCTAPFQTKDAYYFLINSSTQWTKTTDGIIEILFTKKQHFNFTEKFWIVLKYFFLFIPHYGSLVMVATASFFWFGFCFVRLYCVVFCTIVSSLYAKISINLRCA